MFRKRFLIFLFLFSLLIRSLVFHFYLSKNENFWQVDSTTYHQVANCIASGCGISYKENKPCFYRLPGYPLFLSIFYYFQRVCPAKPWRSGALWFQIFLASLIPILIFFLSLSLFPTNLLLAKLSSIYSAVHLGFVLYSGFFMSESLFLFFFLLFAIFFFNNNVAGISTPVLPACPAKPWRSGEHVEGFNRTGSFFLSGLFLGLASLVRPVGQYFIILSIALIFLPLVLSFDKLRMLGVSKDKKIRSSFLLFLGWVIPVSFWLIRNYMLLGHIFFHTLPGGHFLYLSASRVAMHEQNCTYWQARQNLQEESTSLIKVKEQELKRPLNEIEHCKVLEGLAVKYFIKHPGLAVKNWFTDMMRTTLSLYSAELIYLYNDRKEIDYFNKKRTTWDMFRRYLFPDVDSKLIKVILFFEVLFFFFVLLGFASGVIKVLFLFFVYLFGLKKLTQEQFNGISVWLKASCFVGLFILLSLSGGYARMRLPAEPFLIILAFSFWLDFVKKYIKKDLSCDL